MCCILLCVMAKFMDLTAKRFGRLTVISRISKTRKWECICDCGNAVIVFSANLMRANTRSCGCLRRETMAASHFKHGHNMARKDARTSTYSIWAAMIQRCKNPNHHAWDLYGGRGIIVCERWLDFRNFLADMGVRPIGLTLDRIDPSGNYEPGNCRWATWREQRLNQRRMLTHEAPLKS